MKPSGFLGFNRWVFDLWAIGFFVDGRSGFWVDGRSGFLLIGRSNWREMCDRIRFVSPLVCPRREGQLVRPRVRQGLKPLSQSESPPKKLNLTAEF
ncbi:hypothetical protein [Microcoleus vaginatus]|uniref:hypothetical protein n=1 Tax=Microcoleus vaginatus TaxID=119532 RepID=UPI00168A20C0|nr:hypothetical protein [Microcoleus sp. FACHB-84]MBD2009479.1 hypothetical protein [Microcoleus sp. FACHB-45]